MERAFELAGWCAAEAIRLLSQSFESKLSPEEAALLPFLVIQKGAKQAITVLGEASPKTFQEIELLLDQLSPSDVYAVLVRDAYITIGEQRSDALILDSHHLIQPRQSFCMAIPYDCPDADTPFAVHKPKLVSHAGFDIGSTDVDASFARGRESHQEGAAVWRAHNRLAPPD